MARFDHVNIMSIFDYGEEADLVYLVMPYLPDGSIQDILELYGPFSLQEACQYIQQAADALDYAHASEIIHRDLKPSNFLLHPDGRLLLADFGIARVRHTDGRTPWSTLTGQGSLIGTPGYMAPEAIHGKPIDHRADVYALDIVLFQMLSSAIPFQGDTYAKLIQQLQDALPSLHQFDPAIPAAVDAVIQRAAHQQPEERYASAGAFAQALWQAATYRTVSTPYSTIIDPPQTSKLLSGMHGSHSPKASVVLQEPLVPTAISDTPVKPVTLHAKDTHPVVKKAKTGHFSLITLLVFGLLICGLALLFTLKGSLYPATQILVTPIIVTPIIGATPTPALSSEQQAVNAVRDYYDTWNNRSYPQAYSQLEPVYQKMHPYSTLLNSYVNTLHSSVKIEGATQLSDGEFKIMVTDYAVEKSPSGTQTVNKVYHGYFLVKQENGSWKLIPYFKYSRSE